MKYLLIVTALLWSSTSQAQTQSTVQAYYYQQAYRAILASPEFRNFRENKRFVCVFDSIVFQDQGLFLTELGKNWHYQGRKEENRLRDSLDIADKQTWHEPYYSLFTANLTAASTAKRGCVVILFFRLQKDMLLAEVSINQGGGAALRDILPTFNQTLRYLLFFEFKGKVRQYYTQAVSYN